MIASSKLIIVAIVIDSLIRSQRDLAKIANYAENAQDHPSNMRFCCGSRRIVSTKES